MSARDELARAAAAAAEREALRMGETPETARRVATTALVGVLVAGVLMDAALDPTDFAVRVRVRGER